MSWKKFFSQSPGPKSAGNPGIAHRNYGSYLPEVYSGHPNRIERYYQYESMDGDSEVNSALDILSEFCTQNDSQNNLPFQINYKEKATDVEIKILESTLQKWCKMNEFKKRAFRLFRNTLKYGDQFFIRDPETFEWYWVDPTKVDKIIVNEAEAKEPESYIIRDLNLNRPSLQATQQNSSGPYNAPGTGPYTGSAYTNIRGGQFTGPSNLGGRFDKSANQFAVKAEHVIHLSLSEGLDANWPFGNSILEMIYKVYKQKELLEDAVIIYRVQRAPERRVFYIDVGNMPTNLAMAFVERVKNEIWQRRLPSLSGGGTSVIDAGYNPIGINEDYFFPQTCLSMDTEIPLLDGRTLTLSEIVQEYSEGKVNYVYGLDNKTFELEPAEIVWAGVTRKNAVVMRITLDNGKTITATPDHKFITRDGSEIQAQDLVVGQSLMPLDIKLGYSGPKQTKAKYVKYISNADGKTNFVHVTVANKPMGKDTQVHHIDFNSFNNNPNNLITMTTEDHILLHKNSGTYSLRAQWDNEESRNKLINGIRNLYLNASDEFRQKISDRNRVNSLKAWKNFDEDTRNAKIENVRALQRRVAERRKIKYSIDMFNRMNELFDDGVNSVSKLTKYLRNDSEFQLAFNNANPAILREKGSERLLPTDATLNKLVNLVGFKTFGDWKVNKTNQKSKYSSRQNHKIVSIEFLEGTMDTGDITIKSKSQSHWFGLDAGIYVHNSDGRGSKVETLPGGQNLGEIDDLKFFTNKLFRALRIPSSYMPTGPDDSGNTVNDGRVGTALIQELRFNKYCERLQNLVSPIVDREFKLYLKFLGINIDSSLFDLEFNEPMNFAKYRQLELDTAQSGVYANISQIPQISKRFGLKRFLGLTDDEIRQNEEMWMEENDPEKLEQSNVVGADLRNIGVTGGAIESDLESAAPPPEAPPEEVGVPTAELGAPIPTAVPTGGPAGGGMGV